MDDKGDVSGVKQRSYSYAIPVRQADIHDNNVGRTAPEPFQRVGAGRKDPSDVEPRVAQHVFKFERVKRLVFQNRNGPMVVQLSRSFALRSDRQRSTPPDRFHPVVEAHGNFLAGHGMDHKPDQFLVVAATLRKPCADSSTANAVEIMSSAR
ncbi:MULTISPECIES: hypothetical protein [unclassified Mesorhizobium]|uniref:hypothetical protein n=1 Tax=unclassified Mesorhizobium TaxID=325217 RepID=UPI001FD88714|nr:MULTISPECIES: hypothetical protein [unclassified Mesorhizobium]WJI54519.1 hypothetical protein NLY33_14630 [Mesorhizobium sp. C432A]